MQDLAVDAIPSFDEDLFSPEALADSAPAYRRLRDLGPVVWLSKHGMYGMGRFDDVRDALRADGVLISGKGVSADISGRAAGGSMLTTDGDVHARLKRIMMKPLMPAAVQNLKDRLETEAADCVRAAASGEEVEAMGVLASHLPTRVVSHLVGFKDVPAETMLRWSDAAFDSFGPPDNPRAVAAFPRMQDMFPIAANLGRDNVLPGSWAESLFDAVDAEKISPAEARGMIVDYTLPSLDTTILATGQMLWSMATVEGAFQAVRSNPELVSSAVFEAVRLASPVRGFTRSVEQDYSVHGQVMPAGSRVWLLNGAANLDERHYPDPETFDVTRNPRDHVGWGYGTHLCAGFHLARLEMETLLRALISSVRAIEPGTPERLVNNGLQGFRKLPLTLHPA